MKIEKLTENKIRIIVNLEELENNNLNLNDFVANNIESQKFFLDILNKAEKEVGFSTKDCKLLIETFSSIDEVFVFTITKFSESKKNLKIKKANPISILKNPIFKFSSFDEFCNLCGILEKLNISINSIAKRISLYFYNDTYYLIFCNLNLNYKNLSKLFSIISEFSTIVRQSNSFEARIFEYGRPIIKRNALQTGIKYFVY